MTTEPSEILHCSHPRLATLAELLHEDGVPLTELRDAFILVNKEVLRHAKLVEMMGAPEIGLVTKAAERLLNLKLETESKSKRKSGSKAKTGAGALKAMQKKYASSSGNDIAVGNSGEKEDADDDWDDI